MAKVLLSLTALLLISSHLHGDYASYQYGWLLAISSIPIAYYLTKKMGLLFGIFSAYIMIMSHSFIYNLHARYYKYPAEVQSSMSVNGAFTLLLCLVVMIGLIELPEKWIESIKKAIPVWTVLGAVYVIYHRVVGMKFGNSVGYSGYLDYSSASGYVMAIGASFLVPHTVDTRARRVCGFGGLLIVVCALFLCRGASSFGVLAIVLAARTMNVWMIPLTLIGGWISVGGKMFDSSHRFEAYKIFTDYLFHSKWWVFGTGLGTFQVYSPTLTLSKHFMVNQTTAWLWLQAHNDWLQCCFELGVVGLVLAVCVYFQAIFKTYSSLKSKEFAMGIGLGGCALFQYPCHLAPSAFLVALFLRMALLREAPTDPEIQGLAKLESKPPLGPETSSSPILREPTSSD